MIEITPEAVTQDVFILLLVGAVIVLAGGIAAQWFAGMKMTNSFISKITDLTDQCHCKVSEITDKCSLTLEEVRTACDEQTKELWGELLKMQNRTCTVDDCVHRIRATVPENLLNNREDEDV